MKTLILLFVALSSASAFAGEINTVAPAASATLLHSPDGLVCHYSGVIFEEIKSPAFPMISVLRERFPGRAGQWTPVDASIVRIIEGQNGTYSVSLINPYVPFAPEGKCADMRVKLVYSVPSDK
jgi:hypothetical protein